MTELEKTSEQLSRSLCRLYIHPAQSRDPVRRGCIREEYGGPYRSIPGLRVEIKRVIAEGDLVAAHNLVTTSPESRGTAGIDIFRLVDGKIVEHWDARQTVPETAANPNTMF